MAEETVVNPPSSSANQIKKLKSEIGNLKGRFTEIKRQVEQRTKYLKYGASGEVPDKPFYILVKRKSGEWFLYGRYDKEQEYKDAINKIKSEKGKRHSNVADYYITFSEKEVERFLKVSRYKEKQYHEKIQKEISRLPTTRWTENVRIGVKIEEPKQIHRTIEEYSGYEIPRKQTMPHMVIPVWGSITQRKERVPVFGGTQTRTKQPVKRVIPHDEYKTLLDSGYTREDLESNGIVDKFSRYYQEESVFPNHIVYRPVSFHQSFLKVNPPKTIYQRRQEKGLPYESFKPDIVGTIDPLTGQRKTSYKFLKVRL